MFNKFSVILAGYKCSEFIEECLDSIQNQTYFKYNNNYEIILGIDGCLETLEKIQQIKNKYRNLRIILLNKNYGLHITINTLLQLTKFENIIKFDCDDTMFNNFIEEVSKYLEYDVIQYKFENYKINKETAILQDMFCTGSMLYKKRIFEKLGGYQNWICAADSELEKRIFKANLRVYRIDKSLFYRRLHKNSLTMKKETCGGSQIRNEFSKKIKAINKNSPIFVKPEIGEFKEII